MANVIRSKDDFSIRDLRKSGGKGRVRAIFLFFFLFLLTLQGTTQYIAHELNHHPSLGSRVTMQNGIRLYPSHRGIIWTHALIRGGGWERAGGAVRILFAGLSISFMLSFICYKAANKKTSIDKLYGSAHWANIEEVIAAGLLTAKGKAHDIGVVVGGWFNGKVITPLLHYGKEHILCFAPTRAGKGVSLVLPTLLYGWLKDSVFVFDIKGENYALTAGYRQKELGQKIIKLDFSDPEAIEFGTSATFNPLNEVQLDRMPVDSRQYPFHELKETKTNRETSTIQQIVAIIMDPRGEGKLDHWGKTASSLMLGAVTHLLYAHQAEGLPCPGLGDVLDELTRPIEEAELAKIGKEAGFEQISGGKGGGYFHPDDVWKARYIAWQNYPHYGGLQANYDANGNVTSYKNKSKHDSVHPIVAHEAQTIIEKPEKEAGSVISTAVSNLALLRDPVVKRNTSRSTFKISHLMRHDKAIGHESAVSLYLVVNPNDQTRLMPLTRLFVTQLLFSLVERMDFKDGRSDDSFDHRLLLLLDEFPALGRLDLFQKALGFIGGYGVKAFIVCQGLSQIQALYGKEESIRVGCHLQIAFAPNEDETAEYLSKLTGKTTIIKDNISYNYQDGKRSKNVAEQEIERFLLTPDECRRLPASIKDHSGDIIEPGEVLIFPAGHAPIKGRQTLYFKDKEMSRRSKIPPPPQSDKIIGLEGNSTAAPVAAATGTENTTPAPTVPNTVKGVNAPKITVA